MTLGQDKSHNNLQAINFLNNKVLPCFLNCNNKNSNNKAVIVPGKGKCKTLEIRIPT